MELLQLKRGHTTIENNKNEGHHHQIYRQWLTIWKYALLGDSLYCWLIPPCMEESEPTHCFSSISREGNESTHEIAQQNKLMAFLVIHTKRRKGDGTTHEWAQQRMNEHNNTNWWHSWYSIPRGGREMKQHMNECKLNSANWWHFLPSSSISREENCSRLNWSTPLTRGQNTSDKMWILIECHPNRCIVWHVLWKPHLTEEAMPNGSPATVTR